MASQAVAAEAGATAGSGGVSRREFLYYIWGASIALVTVQSVGFLVWFLIPRFREGEFGGTFTVDISDVPGVNDAPINFPDGRFWLVNLDTQTPNELMYPAPEDPLPLIGAAAIYKVCTHLGCIYAWTPANNRFECPCHGSKYRLDGRRIQSPAPRSLDRFRMEALGADGTVLAESSMLDDLYQPLVLPEGTAAVRVDTGSRKEGWTQTLLCTYAGNCP